MIQVLGQDSAVNTLERSISAGRVAHAYLLVGPPRVGKMTFAIAMAQAVNCLEEEKPCGQCSQCTRIAGGNHADVVVVSLSSGEREAGEGPRTEISIDQVREIQRLSSLKPYEGRYRIFIFDGAERLSSEASNSLLKTLEEPAENVILLLLVSDQGHLLPTIVSRCQRLEFQRLPTRLVAEELEKREMAQGERALEIAGLSDGSLGWAFEASEKPSILEERQQVLETIMSVIQGGIEKRFAYAAQLATAFFRNREAGRKELDLWHSLCRDLLLLKEETPQFLKNVGIKEGLEEIASGLSSEKVAHMLRALGETQDQLEQNANARLALEVLMLSLPPAHSLISRRGR